MFEILMWVSGEIDHNWSFFNPNKHMYKNVNYSCMMRPLIKGKEDRSWKDSDVLKYRTKWRFLLWCWIIKQFSDDMFRHNN